MCNSCTSLYGRFRDWFIKSMKGMEKHLLRYSQPSQLMFIGEELSSGEFYAKMVSLLSAPSPHSSHTTHTHTQDHLVCYLPGTLLLGVHNGLSRKFTSLAEKLMTTCYKMYEDMPTKLSPEIVHFNISKNSKQDIYVKVCSCYGNIASDVM